MQGIFTFEGLLEDFSTLVALVEMASWLPLTYFASSSSWLPNYQDPHFHEAKRENGVKKQAKKVRVQLQDQHEVDVLQVEKNLVEKKFRTQNHRGRKQPNSETNGQFMKG